MSRLRLRIALVSVGLLVMAGLSFAGRSLLASSPYFASIELAFSLVLSMLLLLGGLVFMHAAVTGSDNDLIKFSRPPGVWIFSFKGNVGLTRFSLFGFGVFLLVFGVLGVANFFA